MNWKPIIKDLAHWMIPPGFQDVIRRDLLGRRGAMATRSYKRIRKQNLEFRDRHVGERCFVLATGPSIKEQDLTPLRDEWCFGVSEFYRHRHYALIKPAYYVFAPNHAPFTDDDMMRELCEMKARVQDETFFFSTTDLDVVQRSNLVDDPRRLRYLRFRSFGDFPPSQIDLTADLPNAGSAAIIAVYAAIYMGFSEIYLVGCDHDLLWRWDGGGPVDVEKLYEHFYEGNPAQGHNPTDVDGLLRNAIQVRETYRWMDGIASRKGTRIFNANPRSYLDVVPKVPFTSLFGATRRAPRPFVPASLPTNSRGRGAIAVW